MLAEGLSLGGGHLSPNPWCLGHMQLQAMRLGCGLAGWRSHQGTGAHGHTGFPQGWGGTGGLPKPLCPADSWPRSPSMSASSATGT